MLDVGNDKRRLFISEPNTVPLIRSFSRTVPDNHTLQQTIQLFPFSVFFAIHLNNENSAMGHDLNTLNTLVENKKRVGWLRAWTQLFGIAGGVWELQIAEEDLKRDKSETKYGSRDKKVEYDMSWVLLEKPRPNKQCIDLTLNYRVITG